ncbi:MAG: hypothetical protein CBC25_03355 [Pelagibacteraceae bacterium TMED65]|nr:MAG: hypothetical protein CBC25_03355 [Pelagibacteraceae bacterium TMED65]
MANKNFIVKNGLDVGGLITGTTTTQSASDNSTKLASTAYVTTAVSNLVDGAPSTLNTLNEIAAALNDDAALNTTLTNSIATKLPLAGGTMTGVLKINSGDDSLPTLASSTKAVFATDNTANFESSISIIGASNNGSAIINFGDYANEDAGQIKYKNDNGGSDYMAISVNTSEALRILHNGNVGIGTTSPNTTLSVVGSSANGIELGQTTSATTDSQRLFFSTSSGSNSIRSRSGALLFSTGATAGSASGTERMRMDSSGNVGIGETTPLGKLHVKTADSGAGVDGTADELVIEGSGDSGLSILSGASNYGTILFSDSGDSAAGRMRYEHNNNALNFGTNGSWNRMYINSSGNVGIGATPSYKLDVQGAAGDVAIFRGDANNTIRTYLGSSYQIFQAYNGTNTNQFGYVGDAFYIQTAAAERMRIDSSGKLLLKKTSSAVSASGGIIDGGEFIASIGSSANTYLVYNTTGSAYSFYVNGSGQIYAAHTGISSISDERLKENIVDLETGLPEIMSLKPRRFDWKNGDGKNIAGFVAQEVETVFPDLVDNYLHDELDDAKSVRMGDMLPTLVKAVQEQQAQIDELKAKLESK